MWADLGVDGIVYVDILRSVEIFIGMCVYVHIFVHVYVHVHAHAQVYV